VGGRRYLNLFSSFSLVPEFLEFFVPLYIRLTSLSPYAYSLALLRDWAEVFAVSVKSVGSSMERLSCWTWRMDRRKD